MTEYEIYSYEAFRRKYEDEIRIVERAEADDLNQDSLLRHELALKSERPHFARMDESHILELTSVLRNGKPTLAGIMLFSTYPQAFFLSYLSSQRESPARKSAIQGQTKNGSSTMLALRAA